MGAWTKMTRPDHNTGIFIPRTHCGKCVGSLTSLVTITEKMQELGTSVYRLYPRLELLTIFSCYSKGSTFSLGTGYYFSISWGGGGGFSHDNRALTFPPLRALTFPPFRVYSIILISQFLQRKISWSFLPPPPFLPAKNYVSLLHVSFTLMSTLLRGDLISVLNLSWV